MRIGGLASGIDTDSLIKEMMAVQKMPLDKLTQQKTFTEWQQEALREKNLAFSTLRTSASNLRLQSSFNAYSATSSNSTSLTVETTAKASSGIYKVEVTGVASSAKMHSASPIITAGNKAAKSSDLIQITDKATVTVKGNDGAALVPAIEITDKMSYEQVAKKIQDATAGKVPELKVSFDDTTSRFFISTKGMGENQNFSLEFSSTELKNQIINNEGTEEITTKISPADLAASKYVTATATSGSVKFDGIEITGLTSNKTTVNGIVLNLIEKGPETTINVQSNPEKPLEMIKNFVESYNKTISELEKQLVEKRYPDFQPLSDEQKKDMSDKEIELWEDKARSGLLRNDPILKKAVMDLRRAFMDEVKEIPDGNFKHLSQIGINTGTYTEGGKLFINEDKLKEALANKPDEVMNLFVYKDAAGNGVGVGDRVYKKMNEIVSNLSSQAGSLSSSVDNSTISKKIKQMNQEITRWQDKLVRIEDRYWKQFTAMEKAMSQMNSQSTWMQQNMFGGA